MTGDCCSMKVHNLSLEVILLRMGLLSYYDRGGEGDRKFVGIILLRYTCSTADIKDKNTSLLCLLLKNVNIRAENLYLCFISSFTCYLKLF